MKMQDNWTQIKVNEGNDFSKFTFLSDCKTGNIFGSLVKLVDRRTLYNVEYVFWTCFRDLSFGGTKKAYVVFLGLPNCRCSMQRKIWCLFTDVQRHLFFDMTFWKGSYVLPWLKYHTRPKTRSNQLSSFINLIAFMNCCVFYYDMELLILNLQLMYYILFCR